MNSNPNAKVVLCYGDSNTWGQNDDKNTAGRYLSDVRWTGQLQKLLGDDFYIIEEGLGGRTTDLEHYNPKKPSRNGFTYFIPCLTSHNPIDVVLIMIGTNDLKIKYDRSATEIANALIQYVEAVKSDSPETKVLLISPAHIDNTAPKFNEYYIGIYDGISANKSKDLAQAIKKVAESTESEFFDASTVTKPGQDGVHFDIESHGELAKSLAEIVKKL